MMKVTLLCSNKAHPIYEHLENWCINNKNQIDLHETHESYEPCLSCSG